MSGPIRGLWLDDPPAIALKDDYLSRLEALRLDEIAVMVDSTKPGLGDLRWTPRQLEQLALGTRRIRRRVLTFWGEPDRTYVFALGTRLRSLVEALEAGAVELDLEGPWKPKRLNGYPSLAAAGAELGDVVRRAGVEYEITTFPARLRTVATALEHADRLLLQVYPVSTRQGQAVDYHGSMGPVRWPREALAGAVRRLAPTCPRLEVSLGLPLYKQSWPGVTAQTALDEALSSGMHASPPPRRVRWWSSKWILGSQVRDTPAARRRGEERQRWLAELAAAPA